MERMQIRGGRPLCGTVRIHGAKNSALPILSAALLCGGRSVLVGCPELLDVSAAAEILRQLGCSAERVGGCMVVDAGQAKNAGIPPGLSRRLRASVNFLGALLNRFGEGELAMPGGCALGSRPIDYHLDALRLLGAETELSEGILRFRWADRHGGEITLPFPSVGATENVILAALSVPEPVTLRNAAREPEIEDLCRFLSAAGARIGGAGSDCIRIRGGLPLTGAVHTILPDRMETATYLAMTAACGGEITLEHTDPSLLRPVLDALEGAGAEITETSDTVTLRQRGRLRGMGRIRTEVYPGFPTDAQAPLMAAALCADGETVFEETVFPERFRHVPELRQFGGEITVNGSRAAVRGTARLHGAEARATDLRGGAGVLIAALAAEGESTVLETGLLRRGYAELEENLRALGASVQSFRD